MRTEAGDLEKIRADAQRGEPAAQYNLGVWYLTGEQGYPDPGAAHEWFARASEAGFAPAHSALAYMHLRGQHVPYDAQRSRELFALAAEAGFDEAMYRLGEMVVCGIGGSSDPAVGRGWFEKAASTGHAQAQCQLGYCLEHGIGGHRLPGVGTQWYMQAAALGHPRAAAALAGRYLSGHTLARDPVKAMYWLQRAGRYPGAEKALAGLIQALGEELATNAAQFDPTKVPEAADDELALPPSHPSTEVFCWSPRISAIHGLADEEECQHLVAAASPFLRPSKVLSRETGQPESAGGRSSGGMSFIEPLRDVVVWNIERRMADFSMLPVANGEPLAILRYGPGDEYRPHVDFFDPAKPHQAKALERGGQRLITILLYLSDVSSGGETVFTETGQAIAPQQGSALLFHNCLPHGAPDRMSRHAGAPVKRGEKWLATRWIRAGDLSEPAPGTHSGRSAPSFG